MKGFNLEQNVRPKRFVVAANLILVVIFALAEAAQCNERVSLRKHGLSL